MLFFFLVPYLNSFLPPLPRNLSTQSNPQKWTTFRKFVCIFGKDHAHSGIRSGRHAAATLPSKSVSETPLSTSTTHRRTAHRDFFVLGIVLRPPLLPPTRSHFLPILCPIRFRKRGGPTHTHTHTRIACGGWPLALTWNSPSRTLKTHRHLSDKICVVCFCCFFFRAFSTSRPRVRESD